MVSGSHSVTACGCPTRSLAVSVIEAVQGTRPSIELRSNYTVADIRFPYVIAGTRLRLATTRDSPARDSRRNPQRRSAGFAISLALIASFGIHTYSLRGELQARFGLFSRRSRGSFQLSLRLLVHYRTPDIFRLGRSALPIQPEIPVRLTRFPAGLKGSPTGLSPSLALHFRRLRLYLLGLYRRHISCSFLTRFSLASTRFTRRYCGHHGCFLFLRLL